MRQQERQNRIQRALDQLPEIQARKDKNDKKKGKAPSEARASTTDPDARIMKGPAGSHRPSYNGQLATDAPSQIIVGAAVTQSGADQGEMVPMVEQIYQAYGKAPEDYLVDGGYLKFDDIQTVSSEPYNSTIYMPLQPASAGNPHPEAPNASDTLHVAAWRERMQTDEAKALYKLRGATAECVNAIARNRGLQQFRVRGLTKVGIVLTWYALAHNVMRAHHLRAACILAV